jgi:GNAT superfamily N-acetyltransferase
MHVWVERAQPADAPVIAEMVGELLHEIMAAIGPGVFGFDRAATESRARDWLTDGNYVVWIAYSGSDACGFLALYESYALYAEGTFGTIPELFVRPSFRGQGVGARLLAEAKGFAGSKGWRRLEVTTPPLPQFDRTRAFYERHGFSVTGGRKMKVGLT